MGQFCRPFKAVTSAVSLFVLGVSGVCGGGVDGDTPEQLRQLQKQNELLQQQMRKQQELIAELGRKVNELQKSDQQRKASGASTSSTGEAEAPARAAASLGKVHLGGEGAVGFFHSQPQGQFPNSEFRVDEARIFAEAPIWGEVYFFTELNLFTREEGGPTAQVGEMYLDAENLSRLWNRERQVKLRVGRFEILFTEYYL